MTKALSPQQIMEVSGASLTGDLVGVGFALATSEREEQRIEVSTTDE